MKLNSYGNEELQLSDNTNELIDECFNELNKVMQERIDFIEKELKMATKWGSDVNPSETTNGIRYHGKEIVENEREEFKRTISEIWKRITTNEFGNMEKSGVSRGDSEKIHQLINDFTTELKNALNITKRNLLVLLESARCIKFFKKYY